MGACVGRRMAGVRRGVVVKKRQGQGDIPSACVTCVNLAVRK